MSDAERAEVVVRADASGYRLEQHVRYEYPRPVTDLHQRLRLVPPMDHGRQRRRSWSIAVEGARASVVVDHVDTFGNLVVDVQVPAVASWVAFRVATDVDLAPHGEHRTRPDRRFLAATPLTEPDAALRALVDRAGPGYEAADVCAAVHAAFTYQPGATDVTTTAAQALAGGRGVCQDYAHVMLAVCRLLGMPARYVSGHLVGEGGSHAWVEVLRPDPARANSWLAEAWDPTHDRRAVRGYVTVAVGRDYADAAPVSGTYEGVAGGTLQATKRLAAR